MLKTYRYRITPTSRQAALLVFHLNQCRWLYNHFLEQRRTAWQETETTLSYYDQCKSLPNIKPGRRQLEQIYSQCLQDVAARLDKAMKAFFRRVKAGENPGYPRFKSKHRYNSYTYPQGGFVLAGADLRLSKIGHIKVVLHRPVEGRIKTCTIIRSSTHKWYVSFACEVEQPKPLPRSQKQTGIDVGLTKFAVLSNSKEVNNPRFFRKEEAALARVNRRLSKEPKNSPDRVKYRRQVARTHERITWRRSDYTHQLSRKIVNTYGLIAVEDLNIARMVHNKCLSKSIHDAAWGQFFGMLRVKAEWAGREFIAVNPAYTSRDCSKCGYRKLDLPLSVRTYKCECCGLVIDRDLNAAKNILARGRSGLSASSSSR